MPFLSEGQKVLAYPLEELLAEKLRSLLERGKSRDYYDVWRLLKEQSSELDFKLLVQVLFKKLAHKQLSVKGIDNFLPKDIVTLEKYWRSELEQQIFQLPTLDLVITDLRGILGKSVAPYLFV